MSAMLAESQRTIRTIRAGERAAGPGQPAVGYAESPADPACGRKPDNGIHQKTQYRDVLRESGEIRRGRAAPARHRPQPGRLSGNDYTIKRFYLLYIVYYFDML